MTSAAPTIVAIETNSAWIVILAISLVTLPVALVLRRIIDRPGALASSVLLGLPLALPLVGAAFLQKSVLPEVSVLRPLAPEVFRQPDWNLLHFMFVSDGSGDGLVPYVFSGAPGRWIMLVGMTFSSVMLLRRMAGTIAMRRLVRRCEQSEIQAPERLVERVRQLSAEADLKKTPRVLLLPDGKPGAFVTAGRRPSILLSPDLIDNLSPDELDAVVAHEIAHLAARDIPVIVVAGLLRDVVAWNPVAHLALSRLVGEREMEADRGAARLTGKPLAVASSLLKMCELMRGASPLGAQPAVAFLGGKARLRRRVSNLLAVADGRASVRSAGRIPYIAAACLAATLGLQAGAKVAEQADFAIVWDAPSTHSFPLWSRDLGPLAKQSGSPKAAAKKGKPVNARTFPAAKYPVFGDGYALRERDFPRWIKAMTLWAKRRGLPPRMLTAEVTRSWRAVRVAGAPTIGPFGFYRIDLFSGRELPGPQRK